MSVFLKTECKDCEHLVVCCMKNEPEQVKTEIMEGKNKKYLKDEDLTITVSCNHYKERVEKPYFQIREG